MGKQRLEVHTHTMYSNLRLLDAINRPKNLIDRAVELGLSGICITDHETLSSHMEVNIYANELLAKEETKDFKVVLGNEIYLTATRDNNQKYYHFILLAKNKQGHRALRELSSRAWLNSYWDRGLERTVTLYDDLKEILQKYPNSLIATTACFLPGQKVRTKKGDKNIEDLTSDDYIMTSKGEWEKINFPTNRSYNGKGNVLTFSKEPENITCTENHQFLVYENSKLIWKEAKFLKRGDKCLEPIKKVQYTNNKILKVSENQDILEYRKKSVGQNYKKDIFRLKDNIILTNEIVRCFGLWLADGHINIHKDRHKYEIGFTFNDKEFEVYYNGFVKKALLDLGLTENDYNINKRPEQHRVDLSINKVEFCLFMKSLFGVSHADNKYIPQQLLNISEDFDTELFFGYFLGDGYFRYRQEQGGEIVTASVSKQLIKDFEQVGLSLQLSGSITISKKHVDKNNTNHQQSYYLTYSNTTLGKTLTKEENISHKRLMEIFSEGKKKLPQFVDFINIDETQYRIKKVKSNKIIDINEKVYCLNTNSHNFILNNIIVHNCLGGELSSNTLNLILAEKTEDVNGATIAHNNIVNFVLWCKELFGEDFYIECAPGCSKDQIIVNQRLLSIAKAFNCKMVIGSDAHYLKKEDRFVHKSYLNSKGGEREVDEFYEYAYLQSNEEVIENLKQSNYDEEYIYQMFENSMEIYNKIENYSLEHKQTIPKVEVKDYPKTAWWGVNNDQADEMDNYPILKSMFTSDDKIERYWVNQCWEALEDKGLNWMDNLNYVSRLEEEADIKKTISEKLETNMFAYPVTLQHYVNLFWECGSMVGAGRGSSCSGLNHYLLGITQLDPIKWNLPFWRLELLRNSLPA